MVQQALNNASIPYIPNSRGLDFELPDKVFVEVKAYHSPRIVYQTLRVKDVIVLQGRKAVELFCKLIGE